MRLPKPLVPAEGLFVTGTSTEVGKTYVGCLMVQAVRQQGRRVGVYKPAASGTAPNSLPGTVDDATQLWEAAGRPLRPQDVSPQRFAAPLAPHLAAAAAGQAIDEPLLTAGAGVWYDACDWLLVEGAGGILSPLGPSVSNIDVAAVLAYPLLIVADNRLGVINQTLLTVHAIRTHQPPLHIAAIILNQRTQPCDGSEASNRAELIQRCAPIPVIALDYAAGWLPMEEFLRP